MPMITIQIAAEPDARLAGKAADAATRITAELLGKEPPVTAVAVDFVPRRLWFIDGKPVEEQGPAAFFLTIRVTEGTNTKDEIARYLAAVFASFDKLLGGIHPVSYVHVLGVRADSYGYQGLSQERRYVEGRPRAA